MSHQHGDVVVVDSETGQKEAQYTILAGRRQRQRQPLAIINSKNRHATKLEEDSPSSSGSSTSAGATRHHLFIRTWLSMLLVLTFTLWSISHSTTISSTASHSPHYDAQPWIPKPPSSSLPESSTESSSLSSVSSSTVDAPPLIVQSSTESSLSSTELSSSSAAEVDAPLLVQSAADRAALLQQPLLELGTPGAPPCSVALENKADYHYEVIESTILRYPLPWHRINCSTGTQPIVFDVALAEDHSFHKQQYANGSSVSKTSFSRYFNTTLAGTIRRRADGTLAQFGRMVRYTAYDRNYRAKIGISCDAARYQSFTKWMKQAPNQHFCLMHTSCSRCSPAHVAPATRQVCWISPLEPACHFPTVDLPQFDTSTRIGTTNNSSSNNNNKKNKTTITLCPSGSKKQTALVHALNQLVQEEQQQQQHPTFRVLLHARMYSGLPHDYAKTVWGPDRVTVVQHDDFVDFQRSIATQCQVLLLLVDPQTTPQYFGLNSHSRLTGFLSQAVAYQIPAVVHADLQRLYHPYWTAPVLTYTNTSTAQFAPHTTALDTPKLRHLLLPRPSTFRNSTNTTSTNNNNNTLSFLLQEPERTLTQALREMIQLLQQQASKISN